MRKGVKAAIIAVVCVVLAVAILIGVLWYIGRDTTPVSVLPVSEVSTTGNMGGMNYYYGPVRSDNIQSIFVSDTQIITEILVKEGQTVKKGDALIRYDTTLSDIQLERAEISVKQAQLALENARKDLDRINGMKPYTPPPTTEPTTEGPTKPLVPAESLPYLYGGKGTMERPYRILWSDDLTYDDDYILSILGDKTEGWFAFEIREQNAVEGELHSRFGLHVTVYTKTTPSVTPTEPDPTDPTDVPDPTDAPDPTTEPLPTEEPQPTEPQPEPVTETRLYYSFFVPTDAPSDDEAPDTPADQWQDDSSGYTAAEIARMRAEKQKEIRDLDLKYRMEQVEYERKKDEADNGTVYAKVDGTVTRLVSEETARAENRALLVVSGGGCYYVDISVDEFTCQTLKPGTPATAQSWWPESAFYEGTVEEVTTVPSPDNNYNGNGNPNVTMYKVVISIPADANVQEGSYLDVQLGQPDSVDSNTLWLQKMFIRYEGSRAYVYKRNADGLLEKCYIQTGSDLWSYYTEVRRGLTMDDWIAFPYGKTVKDGAQTQESNVQELYGYYY